MTPPRSAQSCGNCTAFVANKAANPKTGEPRTGTCCARSPSCFPVVMQANNPLDPRAPQMMHAFQSAFPPINSNLWCREWQLAGEE